jgi:hypothetical protein
MGNYKDEHGQTRVGKFLRNLKDVGQDIAPDILSVASDLTGIEALDKIGAAIEGSNKLTQEQKQISLDLLKLDMADAKSDRENVTQRWKYDMTSDSWLSKNIRPMVLAFNWFLIAILVIAGLFGANPLSSVEMQMFSGVSLLVNGAYFGDRAVNKFKVNSKKGYYGHQ